VESAKPVTMWYQSGTSTRRNTCHIIVGDLAGLCGGQPARAIIWGKRTLRCRERKVRGIANSKDSVLMQGLIHGRRSVRGHPKARSELGAMEHQKFLFGMEMILP
ncbi:hypothetical protein BHE74_00048826, partial [Ensete ventricosum]